jgi:DNA-binding Xre family transcriptional regulator
MAVSYKKLFKLLIDRDMKKKDFKELTGISQGTLNKLQNGGNVMVDVLEKICLNMDCNVEDIMEIYPNPDSVIERRKTSSTK